MDQPAQSKQTGRKIWYGIVITLSVLVLVFSVVGVIGTWVLRGTLSDFTVSLLQTAENTAGRAQEVIAQVEDPLSEVQQIATTVADVSAKLRQSVQDEGLLKLLLPPEQEQKLVDLATKVQDTLATVHEVLAGAANLYETIDRIPFITLPELGLEKVRAVEQTVNEIRLAVEELKGNVAQIRAGAAEKIGVVTEIATRISDRLAGVQDRLAVLDAELEGFQQTLAGVRSAVPTVFTLAALLITLLLVYIGYTQVEVIRLFVMRWRMLGVAHAILPEDSSVAAVIAIPVEAAPATLIEENQPTDEPGEGEAQE